MYELSVIIPVLDEEYHLERLIKALKLQRGVKLDIIVADAGSQDNSRIIAKKYGVKVVKGGLPSVGRNNGTKVAKYGQILFLDADVIFPRGFVVKCLRDMKKRKLNVASVLTKPDSKKIVDRLLFAVWNIWVVLTQKIYPHAPGYCIFSNKAVHKKIGGFNPRLYICDDANYVAKASKIAKFGIIQTFVTTSVRRLDTEGRLEMSKKMVLCGVYRIVKGEPIGNKFKYHFGVHKKR